MRVIVAYDIGDDARRFRVARKLLQAGIRSQRSVFDCDLDDEQISALAAELEVELDPRHDVVQMYFQCKSCTSSRIDIGQAHTAMDEAFWII